MSKKLIVLIILLILTGCENNNKKDLKENNVHIDNSLSEDIIKEDTIDKILDVDNNDINVDDNIEHGENIDDEKYQENNKEILIDDNNFSCEDDVVNYFHKLKEKIIEKVNSDTWENVKQTVMETLDIAYGFCFKGEEIGGYTLNELSDSAKEKILKIVFDIDNFIESKSPGYKESFKESYDTMIESAKKSLGIIKDKIIDIFDGEK